MTTRQWNAEGLYLGDNPESMSFRMKNRILYTDAPVDAPPLRQDHRDSLLMSSDQGRTSECTAYVAAGVVETYRWKHGRIKQQIQPGPIYLEEKRIDGIPGPGSTAWAAFRALKNLKLIGSKSKAYELMSLDDVLYAIFAYGVCMLGFRITKDWYAKPKSGAWLPDENNEVVGGHLVVGCAYHTRDRFVGIQSSWGTDWYSQGFARMSFDKFNREFHGGLAIDIDMSGIDDTPEGVND